MKLNNAVEKNRDYIINQRRWFHQNPEGSLKEFKTAQKIESELALLGIKSTRVGETGLAAVIKGGKGAGKVVALRADIDALPVTEENEIPHKSTICGMMHACGHDVHTASLLGAAKILNENKADFAGEIRLFFQQAEEIGQGAVQFIKNGWMKGVDSIMGIHVAPNVPVGKVGIRPGAINASCDFFRIKVEGKNAHVSTPHKGVDAIYATCQIVVGLQSLVSRETDPLDTVVVGVGKINGGTNYNIVANHVEIEGTTRTFSEETRGKINASVKQKAELIAQANGAKADIYFESYASPLINDEKSAVFATAVAEKLLGKGSVVADVPKSLGADDFAEFLKLAPGVYVKIGTANDNNPATSKALHNGGFDVDEDGILVGTNLFVDYALEFLK